MRTHVCLGISAAVLAAIGWSQREALSLRANADGNFNAVTNLTQKGEIPADLKTLEVENSSGAVRLVGVEGGQTEWEWSLTVRARTERLAQKGAEGATCKAARDGDPLRLVV